MSAISARASSTDTPGRSRATPPRKRPLSRNFSSTVMGNQSAVPAGRSNRAGMTPTTIVGPAVGGDRPPDDPGIGPEAIPPEGLARGR